MTSRIFGKSRVLGEVKYVARDLVIGSVLFAVIAVLLLGGESPGHELLSMRVNAAEYVGNAGTGGAAASFHEGGGWSALASMAVMFATLYAFNLALFRRFRRTSRLAPPRRFSTR